MTAKKGLGRSFSSLIPSELLDESFDPTAAVDEQVSELRQIKLSEITTDPDQPRRHFDDESLNGLANSILEHGVVQPIVVTPHKGGYQIVAGERRFRASQLAGKVKIPALVRTLTSQHKLELSLIENLQRRDLNVLETATAYLKLRDQFSLSLDEISARVGGKSASAISNTLRMLRLPDNVKQALVDGTVSEGQVRSLIGADQAVIDAVLPLIIAEEWTARRVEQFVVDLKKGAKAGKPLEKSKLPLAADAHSKDADRLRQYFDTDVKIQTNTKGAGTIVIKFKSGSELERIQKLLK